MKKMDMIAKGRWTQPNNSPSSTGMKQACCPRLKVFLAALSFAYFAKALSGSYMKSTITQLQKRFDIPSYMIGIIDGSFEMGNLLVIAFVSYFGAKLHRPKIIAVGCVLMSFGTFLIAMPHFIVGRYKFVTSVRSSVNSSTNLPPCSANLPEYTSTGDAPAILPSGGCDRESSVSMWIYVFVGNVLRGIGETPVQPLGISYIDDYAQSDIAALYIGFVQTISIIGPVFGYLLGSVCAKIYVDIGYVDVESIAITSSDSRWVGAWWLGYLIAGAITLMSAVPFWFLPKSLPVPMGKHGCASCAPEQTTFTRDSPGMDHKFRPEEPATLHEVAKEFLPTLKSLLGSPVYILYLCVTVIQFNSLIGMVTFKPKYMEQHYGQSASKANFLMGVINIPAVALGMLFGGVVMKRCKLGIMAAAKFAFGTSLLGYFLSLFFFAMGCENARAAGITVSYSDAEVMPFHEHPLVSECDSGCLCSQRQWDPVCGDNGITYVSPRLAGCPSSSGSGRHTVFEQCRCLGLAGWQPGNETASPGHCPNRDSCGQVFPYFLALSPLSSFIISLGGTPGFVLLIRCIKPEPKSLALGIHTLATCTLAGIPAPIYFGAAIDTTCLKWGCKKRGGRGACRIYNTSGYRIVYLGLTLGLRTVSFFLCILGFPLLEKHLKREDTCSLTNRNEELESLRKENNSIHCDQFIRIIAYNPDRDTRL